MRLDRGKLLWAAVGAAFIYGSVCLDVVLRARHAYLEGEKAASPREALAWYESAATLFTPPESTWSRRARAKIPETRARWKADLEARHIPVTDAMLD